MNKDIIYNFIRQCKLAVVSTINGKGNPEAALVGVVVTQQFEIIFDTVLTSRKYQNITQNPSLAVVIGWDNDTTVQYEGNAEILGDDEEAQKLKDIYFEAYPDGRERVKNWPGLVHIKIAPLWLRYSNFNEPVVIEEITF